MSQNMFDFYYGQDPETQRLNNAYTYMNYTGRERPTQMLEVGNFHGDQYRQVPDRFQDPLDYKSMGYTAAQSNGSVADTLGNAGMASGNPYLMAGGTALKLYGAYSDSQAAEKKEAEERRRQNRIDAYNRLSAERSNTRNQQTHDQNMRSGDFNYGTGVQDRLLYLAGYKGV